MSAWNALSINVAALITGLLLSWSAGEVSWTFVACFGVAALITTLFVRLNSLYVTVVSLPLLFGIFTPLTAWLVARSSLAGGASQWSKTMILSALYPLAMFFPALAIISVTAIIIAVIRLRIAHVKYRSAVSQLEHQRREAARREKRNQQQVSRVRAMSRRPRRHETPAEERVPFNELIRDIDARAERRRAERSNRRVDPRNKKSAPAPKAHPSERKPSRRSLSDDLYS